MFDNYCCSVSSFFIIIQPSFTIIQTHSDNLEPISLLNADIFGKLLSKSLALNGCFLAMQQGRKALM
jgi:hypothetical protein